MKREIFFGLFIVILASAHLGTIRRNEDPIRNTQTDPIAYKQKMEEEKDGVKGPLAYSVKYNPKDTFFIDPPYMPQEKAMDREKAKAEEKQALSDWWEETPLEKSSSETSGMGSSGSSSPEEERQVQQTEEYVEGSPMEGEAAKDSQDSSDAWW